MFDGVLGKGKVVEALKSRDFSDARIDLSWTMLTKSYLFFLTNEVFDALSADDKLSVTPVGDPLNLVTDEVRVNQYVNDVLSLGKTKLKEEQIKELVSIASRKALEEFEVGVKLLDSLKDK